MRKMLTNKSNIVQKTTITIYPFSFIRIIHFDFSYLHQIYNNYNIDILSFR